MTVARVSRVAVETITQDPDPTVRVSRLAVEVIQSIDVLAPTVPAAPTLLTATTISDSEIDLAWTDNASDETGYRVERSLTGVGAWSDISGALAADAVSYSDTGLTASTEYFYRVFAFNASGDSTPSNVDSATTQAAPIPPPSSGNRMGGTGAVRKPPR